jgi:hypothetical protein
VLEATNLPLAAIICAAREMPIDGSTWPIWHPCAPLLLTRLCESQVQDSAGDFSQLPFDPEQSLSQVPSALAQSAVSRTLRRHGIHAFEAKNGTSAIALFEVQQAEIEVVLLDINLPDMLGGEVFETLEQIRQV